MSGEGLRAARYQAERVTLAVPGREPQLNWLLSISSGVHLKPSNGSIPKKFPAEGP